MFSLWTYLWNHVFKRLHDSGTLAFLIVGKDSGDYDDCRQYNAQVQLRKREHTTKLSSFYTSVVRLSRQTTLAGSPWPVPRCMTRCDTHKWEFTTKWSDHVSNYSITCWQEVPLCFMYHCQKWKVYITIYMNNKFSNFVSFTTENLKLKFTENQFTKRLMFHPKFLRKLYFKRKVFLIVKVQKSLITRKRYFFKINHWRRLFEPSDYFYTNQALT